MFAIYVIKGRCYRDTLENLRKLRETQATTGCSCDRMCLKWLPDE